MCREWCCGQPDINGGDDAGARAMAQAVTNDFLAATHIVLLREDRIFATLPDLWEILRHDCWWIGAVGSLLGALYIVHSCVVLTTDLIFWRR
jgi:hypothetical protein